MAAHITPQLSPDDIGLFKKMGIDISPTILTHQWLELGVYNLPSGASIEIAGIFMPATFWRLMITDNEGRETIFETGSGSLSNFMPFALQIANCMVHVKHKF